MYHNIFEIYLGQFLVGQVRKPLYQAYISPCSQISLTIDEGLI